MEWNQVHRDLPLSCTALAEPEEFLMSGYGAGFYQQFAGAKIRKLHVARRVHTFRDHRLAPFQQGIYSRAFSNRERGAEDSPHGTSWKASISAELSIFGKQAGLGTGIKVNTPQCI